MNAVAQLLLITQFRCVQIIIFLDRHCSQMPQTIDEE